MKNFLNAVAHRFGYEVRKKGSASKLSLPSCNERLRHMKTLGFEARGVYDCGAFIGRWAVEIHQIFPEANLILVEPNPQLHEQILQKTESFKEQIQLYRAAVSEYPGTMNLNIWDNPKHNNKMTALAASSLQSHVQGTPTQSVPVEVKRIDDIRTESNIKCDLLKLDLQGHELPALKGAEEVLKEAEVVVTEFGLLEAYTGRSTPRELMDHLYDRGYILYDIADVRYRPHDKAMCSGDLVFVKKDSRLRSHKDYF